MSVPRPGRGLILAAPSSGSGKTTITLGLLRAFADLGVSVRGAKSGPDYIDPQFHAAAARLPCPNLDAWAMSTDRLRSLANGPGLLLIEGAMGLFDGAPPDGRGASADLARNLSLPVVLIVDAARMAQSITPLVAGFARHDPAVKIAGLILNKVGSERHATMLRRALAPLNIPVLGAVPRKATLEMPSRHLGLQQAEERADLDGFLTATAQHLKDHVGLEALQALAQALPPSRVANPIAPLGQRIAVAQDLAFRFAYPHLLSDWRSAGAEILTFSPLENDPLPDCDAVFLPGGYPELHAGRIANASRFIEGLARAASKNTPIYGECGGYMVLGKGLIDAQGTRHAMAGLLDLETSFAQRKLHLGYRRLAASSGPLAGRWNGHEFHYATTLRAEGEVLFQAHDAEGTTLPDMGLIAGSVSGSFAHLIDRSF